MEELLFHGYYNVDIEAVVRFHHCFFISKDIKHDFSTNVVGQKTGGKEMIAFLNWLDGVLWGLPLIVLMIATGLYFTVRSGFFQFRHFGWIMKRTAGQMFVKDENKGKAQNEKGMLSSFEPISTAIGRNRRLW